VFPVDATPSIAAVTNQDGGLLGTLHAGINGHLTRHGGVDCGRFSVPTRNPPRFQDPLYAAAIIVRHSTS